MTISLTIAIYLSVWFTTMFAVLPFGVERVENPDVLHDAGAPQQTHLGKKILVNTVLAAIITGIILLVVNHYLPAQRHVV